MAEVLYFEVNKSSDTFLGDFLHSNCDSGSLLLNAMCLLSTSVWQEITADYKRDFLRNHLFSFLYCCTQQ